MSADGTISPSHTAFLAKPYTKGQSGNPKGRSKTYRAVRRMFQKALLEVTPNNAVPIAEKIIRHAHDDDSPRQEAAWKIMTSYGIGLPEKRLDDDTVTRLAEQMIQQGLAEAAARRAARSLEESKAPIDVEPTK